jgi:hypothetical protein
MSSRYTRHVFQVNPAKIFSISLSNTAGALQSPKAKTVNCQSPLPGPVVILRKKDSSIRFAIDFRLLNHYTVKDSHLLPRIDDTLDALAGAKWYSTLDITRGYNQVSVAPEDRPKTAFAFPGSGLWQFTVLAFGLCNAPAVFERLMLNILLI